MVVEWAISKDISRVDKTASGMEVWKVDERVDRSVFQQAEMKGERMENYVVDRKVASMVEALAAEMAEELEGE